MDKREQAIRDVAMIARNAIDKIIEMERRPWVKLTNKQIMDCTHHIEKVGGFWNVTDDGLLEFAHILEEWLKRKNK